MRMEAYAPKRVSHGAIMTDDCEQQTDRSPDACPVRRRIR